MNSQDAELDVWNPQTVPLVVFKVWRSWREIGRACKVDFRAPCRRLAKE